MNPFLSDGSLQPLWVAASAALDRNGLEWRGRLGLPDLTPEGRRRLGVLLGIRVGPERRTVGLTELEHGVGKLLGVDLATALRQLGHAPRGRREAALARREATTRRREALDRAVEEHLADAPWATAWRDRAWVDGLFAQARPEDASRLVREVAAVLGAAAGHDGTHSRTETAAQLFGDAHALDPSSRLGALTLRALLARDGPASEREAWERAGLPPDVVSLPVLCWGLPLRGASAPARASAAMTEAGLPLHLSTMALRAGPLTVAPGTPVLVVENPRLVEAAAQRALPAAVLCGNGNPTTAPLLAVTQLAASGAQLRYHGDVDSPGLAIASRIAHVAPPWRMGADDYLAAVRAAEAAGVALPHETAEAPATPWDPQLSVEFARLRAVVHEERVMDELLAAHATG